MSGDEDSDDVRRETGAEVPGVSALARDETAPQLGEWLDQQTESLRRQSVNEIERLQLELRHLRTRRWKDRFELGVQTAIASLGLLLALLVGMVIWNAATAHGLVVEAFSVPPDLAQRGLTGRVAASRLLDRLIYMQAHTDTARAASTYANEWGDDVKVAIPHTGISLQDVQRMLVDQLGRETRVTGELVHGPRGLEVSARVGARPGQVFTAPETDIDALIQKAAESVFRQTQPYRYAHWLRSVGRRAEATDLLRRLAVSGPTDERAFALTGLSHWALLDGDPKGARALALEALDLDPGFVKAWWHIRDADEALGWDEAALGDSRKILRIRGRLPAVTETSQRHEFLLSGAWVARALGDHRRAAMLDQTEAALPNFQGQTAGARLRRIVDLALAHDLGASRQAAAEELALGDPAAQLLVDFARLAGLDDWSSPRAREIALLDPQSVDLGVAAETTLWPWIAYARARSGDVAGAEALIALTPADCYLCVRLRGGIAAAKGDFTGAERWYAEAIRQAPSLPAAFAERGRMRQARGEIAAALADFAVARARGPRWPDPVELEGEALLARRDYKGAAKKFEQAAEGAPRWGRLHLKWGEALAGLGRREAAQAQWRAAAALDLSEADRATLAARRL